MKNKNLHQLFSSFLTKYDNISNMFASTLTSERCFCQSLTGIPFHKEFSCFAEEMSVYLLADADCSQIIIVGVEQIRPLDELADEEMFSGEFPLYFTENSHRKSPVYYLMNIADAFGQFFRRNDTNLNPKIMSVLITTSNIINHHDMQSFWDFNDVQVIHQFKGELVLPLIIPERNPITEVFPLLCRQLKSKDFKWLIDRERGDGDDIEDYQETKDSQLSLFDDDDFSTWCCRKEHKDAEKTEDKKALKKTMKNGTLLEDSVLEVSLPDYSDMKVDVLFPYKHPEHQLCRMTALTDLRLFIDKLSSLSEFQERVRQTHLPAHIKPISLHTIFMGPVGSGKTTAARLMGSIFRQSGVLSKGHVVVCEMASFTGTNFGSEEENVRRILELAQGGVLLIDEAYQLATRHPHDPLQKILPLMLSLLSDEENRDISIILAGYELEMERLLGQNMGLRSRFPNKFVFREFTYEEILKMTKMKAISEGFTFTRESWKKLGTLIKNDYDLRDKTTWGNGRYVTNLLDHIYLTHAQRCVQQNLTDSQLLRITATDIKPFPSDKPTPRRSIGF